MSFNKFLQVRGGEQFLIRTTSKPYSVIFVCFDTSRFALFALSVYFHVMFVYRLYMLFVTLLQKLAVRRNNSAIVAKLLMLFARRRAIFNSIYFEFHFPFYRILTDVSPLRAKYIFVLQFFPQRAL